MNLSETRDDHAVLSRRSVLKLGLLTLAFVGCGGDSQQLEKPSVPAESPTQTPTKAFLTMVPRTLTSTKTPTNTPTVVTASPIPHTPGSPVVAISGAGGHTMVLKEDGTVWAWGRNTSGQITDEQASTVVETPTQVPGLFDIVAIAGGGNHSLALRVDGTVWAWGTNMDGQIGNGTTDSGGIPARVLGLAGVVAIAAGGAHSIALRDDETVWAWGPNLEGELGDGTTTNRTSPVQVSGLGNIVAVAAGGMHTVTLKDDGTIWAWGYNEYGQLGDGTIGNRKSAPVQVSGLTGVAAISTRGQHTLALTSDGTVWAWGMNDSGQLGNGSSGRETSESVPTQVLGLANITAIAAGGSHSMALRSDGTVWVWGSNNYGQLGDGTSWNKVIPIQVPGLGGVTTISAGFDHTVVLREDGTVWAWGYNGFGQIGIGFGEDVHTQPGPVQVGGLD
jgi:alpha-tubulin suppressor-like RCC1 family protein